MVPGGCTKNIEKHTNEGYEKREWKKSTPRVVEGDACLAVCLSVCLFVTCCWFLVILV